MLQVSTWGIIGFYLWLIEAAVIMVTAAHRGAQKKRPELTLVVGPLLIICPLIGFLLGTRGGPDLSLICGLAATWLPLLGVLFLPVHNGPRSYQTHPDRTQPGWWAGFSHGRAEEPRRYSRDESNAWTRSQPTERDDPYAFLGLSPGASLQEIKAAWRSCAADSHPDKVAHLGPEVRLAANERMARINEAYETLCRSFDAP
jgi:hypothetical protein